MSYGKATLTETRKEHIGMFDGVRALAIIIILFHHLPAHSFDFYQFSILGKDINLDWLNDLNRYFALSLFTFMSGYLLEYRNPTFGSKKDIWRFLIKRYVRIYPLYMLSLLIYFTIFSELIDLNLCTVITHILGVQIIFAKDDCSPVLTLWYIGLILSYYFIFILMKLIVRDLKSLLLYILALTGIFVYLKIFWGVGDKRFLLYLPVFMTGIWSCKKQVLEKLTWPRIIFFLVIFIISSSYYINHIYPSIYLSAVKPSLFSVISAKAFILVNLIMLSFPFLIISLIRYVKNNATSKIISIISLASYASYLFHRPLWWLMANVYRPHNKFAILVYMLGFGIPLAIIVGYYMQSIYDTYVAKQLTKRFIR